MSVVLVTVAHGEYRADLRLSATVSIHDLLRELPAAAPGLHLDAAAPASWTVSCNKTRLDPGRSLADHHILDGSVIELRRSS